MSDESVLAEAVFDRAFRALIDHVSFQDPRPLRPVLAAALRALDAEVGQRVLADSEPVDLISLADAIEGSSYPRREKEQ